MLRGNLFHFSLAYLYYFHYWNQLARYFGYRMLFTFLSLPFLHHHNLNKALAETKRIKNNRLPFLYYLWRINGVSVKFFLWAPNNGVLRSFFWLFIVSQLWWWLRAELRRATSQHWNCGVNCGTGDYLKGGYLGRPLLSVWVIPPTSIRKALQHWSCALLNDRIITACLLCLSNDLHRRTES